MGIRISGARLASVVANASRIGVISAVALGLNSPYFDITQFNSRIKVWVLCRVYSNSRRRILPGHGAKSGALRSNA